MFWGYDNSLQEFRGTTNLFWTYLNLLEHIWDVNVYSEITAVPYIVFSASSQKGAKYQRPSADGAAVKNRTALNLFFSLREQRVCVCVTLSAFRSRLWSGKPERWRKLLTPAATCDTGRTWLGWLNECYRAMCLFCSKEKFTCMWGTISTRPAHWPSIINDTA